MTGTEFPADVAAVLHHTLAAEVSTVARNGRPVTWPMVFHWRPDGTPAAAGPAWLLWHSHDEQLADLKALAVRGHLTQTTGGWEFRPERVTAGPGLAPGGWEPIIASMHAETDRFLAAKGLTPPEIQWDRLEEIARQVLAETARPETG